MKENKKKVLNVFPESKIRVNTVLIVLGVLLTVFLIISLIHHFRKCHPSCSGAYCGSDADDGCGGTCECEPGGKCDGSVCCYPNCDGNFCGDDGCGGTCSCDRLPNGTCTTVTGTDKDGKTTTLKRCCYKQEHNGVYCGKDGCGGVADCQPGATCSNPDGGICANSGKAGWAYVVGMNTGMEQKDTSSPLECAQWVPQNVKLNLSNYPCSADSDCPYGDTCEKKGGTPANNSPGFCNRNDVYQYWVYDPSAVSGKTCTKYRQGSVVCGVKKPGASAFDIKNNKGPDAETCSGCTISPRWPKSGAGAGCPEQWTSKTSGSAICVDDSGVGKCCLEGSPRASDYAKCISDGLPECSTAGDWWLGDLGEVDGQCTSGVTGPGVHLTPETIKSHHFSDPCDGKVGGSSCKYDDGHTKFDGDCQNCKDGVNRCFPKRMCVATYLSADQQGMCQTAGMC